MKPYRRSQPKKNGGRHAPEKPPVRLRRQLEYYSRQLGPQIERAKALANRKLKKIKAQSKINQMLEYWRQYFVPRHWNSRKKAIIPGHIRSAVANLEYHMAEIEVLEKEIEKLGTEHELATEMNDFTTAKQIQKDYDRTLRTYEQAIQDAKITAKQLQGFKWPASAEPKRK